MIDMDVFNKIVKEAMVGDFTHSSVLEALEGLSHEQAIEKPITNSLSTYEILYHMFVWQDIFLKNIRDEPADWGEANKIANEQLTKNAKEHLSKKTWEQLVDDFKRDFYEADILLETIDLKAPMKTFRNKPTLKMYCILNQHNSYHMGQIIKNRVAQGTWPLEMLE
ncbi:MAG: DinB family protein [Candidatus Heimdallarchaeota archaeon]|nr:MAG: DinB family protein [Candidatus Heimdallarchaeota archaeon]